jgi:hypothetical protein
MSFPSLADLTPVFCVKASNEALAEAVTVLDELKFYFERQELSPVVEAVQIEDIKLACLEEGKVNVAMWRQLTALIKENNQGIVLMREDPFNHGWLALKWDVFHWETMRLRVQNPSVALTRFVFGANGSGKSVGCASIMTQCAVNSVAVDGSRPLIWCFALNQANSQEIQQTNIYEQFPVEYRAESGKPFKRNAQAGMTFSAGKFTDNQFRLPSGCKTEFRFYGDNSDMKRSTEGPRPKTAWSDEEIPQPWIETINSRLLTWAGKTDRWQARWKKMLADKAANPALKVPRELWADLYTGVHIVSFTCKGGYTPAVRAIVTGCTVVKSIEAELLPIYDEHGNKIGFEKVPELIWAADGKASANYFYAWENPFGGNWKGMKEELKGAPREKILWKAYGVAEGTTNVVFTNWNRAAHVLPLERLPKDGTWYHIVDPTDAKRNWAMIWVKISDQQISFLASEWPQEYDHIPGIGKLGPWAIPSQGKHLDGDRGPAQKRVIHSFEGYAKEIERKEKLLEELEIKLHGRSDIADRKSVVRIMDARFANTDSMSHSDSETTIEAMEKHGYYFLPSGKGGGGESNIRTIKDRSGFVSDLLDYDATSVELDEAKGVYSFKGKAPLLRVASCCTNSIFGFENWTNGDAGAGACKDFPDCIGYYAVARPEHINRSELGFKGGEYY